MREPFLWDEKKKSYVLLSGCLFTLVLQVEASPELEVFSETALSAVTSALLDFESRSLLIRK